MKGGPAALVVSTESSASARGAAPETLEEAREFIRDVIALSTLPAIWMGAEPKRIAESLIAVLGTTVRPVFSLVRIPSLSGNAEDRVQLAWFDGRELDAEHTEHLARRLEGWLSSHDSDDILEEALLGAPQPVRICAYSLGHDQSSGLLAAGFSPTRTGRQAPSPLERTLLNVAANQAITACRNVALQQQAMAARDEAKALYDFSRALAADLDLQNIFQKTTDAVTRLTRAKFGAFFHNVVRGTHESYSLYTLSGAPREAFEKFSMPRNTPLFDHTFRGRGTVRLSDVRADPRFGRMGPHHGPPPGHLPVRSYLAVPVVSRSGEVFGGLFLGHPDVNVFDESAERLAEGIAAQAAVALENARLLDRANEELEERRKAEEALREIEKRKDEFLATLSHELRNPLAPIRNAVSAMKLARAQPGQLPSAIAVVERQAGHLTRLVDDLLDISRITRGKLELKKERIDVVSVIDQALEGVRPLSELRGVQLFVSRPSSPCMIEADATRLVQVVGNLLNNACKYNRERGEVHVRVDRRDGAVCLSVRDDGLGLAPESLDRIFEMFVQVESARTRAPGGLGIGLSLAKSLVELHGGRIEARSEGLGRGSEFLVWLPLAEGGGAEASTTPAGPSAPEAPPLRVLVVDDYPDALEGLAMLLEALGHEVSTAVDGEQALAKIAARRPDVVMLDIGLPRMDGYEVARRIRQMPEGAGVYLIAMTGWGQEQDRRLAREAGFDLHVTKPGEPDEIARLLSELAERKPR